MAENLRENFENSIKTLDEVTCKVKEEIQYGPFVYARWLKGLQTIVDNGNEHLINFQPDNRSLLKRGYEKYIGIKSETARKNIDRAAKMKFGIIIPRHAKNDVRKFDL